MDDGDITEILRRAGVILHRTWDQQDSKKKWRRMVEVTHLACPEGHRLEVLWDNVRPTSANPTKAKRGCSKCPTTTKMGRKAAAFPGVELADPDDGRKRNTEEVSWRCTEDATHPQFTVARIKLNEWDRKKRFGERVCIACVIADYTQRTGIIIEGYVGGRIDNRLKLSCTCPDCGEKWMKQLGYQLRADPPCATCG